VPCQRIEPWPAGCGINSGSGSSHDQRPVPLFLPTHYPEAMSRFNDTVGPGEIPVCIAG